jgi:hypothetical protein
VPPVWRSASASIAPHPAMSSRATATACCTNPDHARRGPRLHEGADLVELGLVERDSDLPRCHTGYHTTGFGPRWPGFTGPGSAPRPDLSVAAGSVRRAVGGSETPSLLGDGISQVRSPRSSKAGSLTWTRCAPVSSRSAGLSIVLARAGGWTVKGCLRSAAGWRRPRRWQRGGIGGSPGRVGQDQCEWQIEWQTALG